jgi:hypothetical protein
MQRICAQVRRKLNHPLFTSILSLAVLTILVGPLAANAQVTFYSPGSVWKDTNGNRLEVHGGSIILVGGTYYWVGEADDNSNNFSGINCYSSPDLSNWTYRGDILPPQSSGDLVSGNVVQRPKVLYNSATSTYVMWLHIDNSGYTLNHAGVATSSTPCGTYTYKGSSQPLGFRSFDIGAFEDTDGTAYLLTTDNGVGLRVERMASDYQSVTQVVAELPSMEGPAMIHDGSYYYIFASHLTGWAPNDNQYATATSPSGKWSALADFAALGTKTYSSQDSWILPVNGSAGTTYIYMGDRWISSHLANSGYLWLPLHVSGTTVSMDEYYEWTLNIANGTWAVTPGAAPTSGSNTPLINANSGLCLDVTNASTTQGTQLEQWTCTGGTNQNWKLASEGSGYQILGQNANQVVDVAAQSIANGATVDQWDWNGGTNQQWIFANNGNGYFNIINVNSGMCLEVKGASKTKGALVNQYLCNGGANQLWKQ